MFNFIRKLFKALNSSGKSWQLSLAVVLAMFAGFLPGSSLILLAIVFLALILNINFGIFLLFCVVFSGIGYLFDPLFESLGYTVLTNESLEGLFTTLYNSAIFRWTSFNYTLVTGSLIVSVILALPVFFVINRLIGLYRVQIGSKLNEWRVTRWMKLFNEEAKSTSTFRWIGLGVFGGLATLIILFFVVLFDPLAKVGLERSLSCALQAEVSLKDFSSSLSDLSIKISGMEIADKEKLTHNLMQADKIAFDLGFAALLEKKTMIEKVEVDALAFDIKRTKPAQEYAKRSEKTAKEEEKVQPDGKSEFTNPFVFPNVDDILGKEELSSLKEAELLKADIKAAQEKWTKVSSDLKQANEVAQIKEDAKKLEASLKGADLQKIATAKNDIDALKSRITMLKSKYTSLQKEFDADQKNILSTIKELKDLPLKDVERLKKKYSLDSSGGANLIGTLISEELGAYMKRAIKYYGMIKPYLNDSKNSDAEEIKPPRGEGRWIKYANLSTTPTLLIKETKVNVKMKEDTLNVDIYDISSNQKLYGKPMRLHADAKGTSYKHITADAVNDRRYEKDKTDIDLKVKGYKKEAYALKSFEMQDILTDMNFKGKIIEREISAASEINVLKANLKMPSVKLVDELLSGISSFKVDIGLKGAVDEPSIQVKSDLDRQLASGVKSMASKAASKFESELTEGVMKKVGNLAEGVNTDLGEAGSLLSSKQDALSGINLDFGSASKSLKRLLPF